MKIDLDKEIKMPLWRTIHLILICLSLGAGATMLNTTLGLFFIGLTIIIFAMPLIIKLFEGQKNDT